MLPAENPLEKRQPPLTPLRSHGLRPAGENFVIKVIDTKTKAEIVLTEANFLYGTGTDKKGKDLTILTVTGLKAGTKYRIEMQAYTGASLGAATYQAANVTKVTVSTAKFAAVLLEMALIARWLCKETLERPSPRGTMVMVFLRHNRFL